VDKGGFGGSCLKRRPFQLGVDLFFDHDLKSFDGMSIQQIAGAAVT